MDTNQKPGALTSVQIACLTACVPCSGEAWLDKIISVSLRLKLATEFANGMLSNNCMCDADSMAKQSLQYADALLAKFDKSKEGPTSAEKTSP